MTDKPQQPPVSPEDQALLDRMRAKRDETRKRYAEQGRPAPLPADSPIFKKWETDEFLPDVAEPAPPPQAVPNDAAVHSALGMLGDPDPRDRLRALRSITASSFPDERVLAKCEELLEDRTIVLLGIPYSYGELRWVAAEAVAAVRTALGRPAPVVIADALAPVTSVRPLADAAGIVMEPGKDGIESSIKTLEKLAALGKVPRRKITR